MTNATQTLKIHPEFMALSIADQYNWIANQTVDFLAAKHGTTRESILVGLVANEKLQGQFTELITLGVKEVAALVNASI